MRRILTLTMLAMMLGTLLTPAVATAQQWDPCGDYAADGTVPDGYELAIGDNGGSGSQLIVGDEGANTLRGGSGNDILCGFDGDDTLVGGSGGDWIDGGADTDVLRGNSGNDTLANGETNREGSGNDGIITIEPEPEPAPIVTIELTYFADVEACDVTATRTNVDGYPSLLFYLYINERLAFTTGTPNDTATFSHESVLAVVRDGDETYVTVASATGVIATSETETCGA